MTSLNVTGSLCKQNTRLYIIQKKSKKRSDKFKDYEIVKNHMLTGHNSRKDDLNQRIW